VAKAGEAALRELRATITALQFFLQRLGAVLKNAIGANAQCVLDSEELAELIIRARNEWEPDSAGSP